MIALGTTVLRVRQNNIAWSAGNRVSQIVQSSGNGSKPVGIALAQRTGPPSIVAAASDKFGLWQILNYVQRLAEADLDKAVQSEAAEHHARVLFVHSAQPVH